MQLTEQQIIHRDDPRFAVIDTAAFKSKNLYNAANYEVRQAFFREGTYLTSNEMDKLMQPHEAYKALSAKVAQQVLKQLAEAWKAFREAKAVYRENASKFTGYPRLPRYKHKTEGRNLLIYTIQALSQPALKDGLIRPSQLPIMVKTEQRQVQQVRIVPKIGYYTVEVVYEKQAQPATVDPALYAGLDPGVTNLAAIASNKEGFIPRIVNGRPLKAWNQWYNMRMAELRHQEGTDYFTRQMERVTNKRNRRIAHYLHTASRRTIDLLVAEGIGTLFVGKNPLWKQKVNHGKVKNQNFVCIPHAKFIEMLIYKAELVGITVIVTEESYTSKASFLDLDELPIYDSKCEKEPVFSGKRIKRGLYRAKDGCVINADINGAYNTIRKRRPDAFAKGVAGYRVHPIRLVV